ncbi:helix-turn-helix domain-containing protein [Tropicimonas sediminicola]|uniref:Helix-turn-helix domain-containing protein n=1 Tax=Tropicimonas sediminicola TaxID=1031541 RepID=A0A239CBA9_9RHOB|nr:helix-turn-helix transcriptional regulator [Tropicimonas sediminicola]SNS16734.1 Helix-turn-helix domain-containing protein [Tropicimonas sediminicola]
MEELIYIGAVHASFTAIFLATKRERTLNDTVLALWMVFMALPLLSGIAAQRLEGVSIPLLTSNLIYPLTYGPFLWLYVETLTGDVGRIRRGHLLHFLPFAAVSAVQLLFGWKPAMPNPDAAAFGTTVRSIGAVNLLLLLVYTGAVVRRLRQHGREVVDHFSELSSRITLVWLYWITLGVFCVFLLLFLGSALSLPALLDVHIATLVALILVLSFFGLRQTQVFDRQPEAASVPEDTQKRSRRRPTTVAPEPAEPRADTSEDPASPRYSRSGLTEERAETIARRLDAYMRAGQPYMDAELTIEKLAKRMAVPRHHLTQVISERYGKNFYLFVNEYRIETVKQTLRAPEAADRTLLEIAYDCGFNSKSTFNTAFKRLTGMTPSQYREQKS